LIFSLTRAKDALILGHGAADGFEPLHYFPDQGFGIRIEKDKILHFAAADAQDFWNMVGNAAGAREHTYHLILIEGQRKLV
jgi:hypothetical protein